MNFLPHNFKLQLLWLEGFCKHCWNEIRWLIDWMMSYLSIFTHFNTLKKKALRKHCGKGWNCSICILKSFLFQPYQDDSSNIHAFLGFISTRLGLWSVLPKDTPRQNQVDPVGLEPGISRSQSFTLLLRASKEHQKRIDVSPFSPFPPQFFFNYSFYALAPKDQGHIVLPCLSVCLLSVCRGPKLNLKASHFPLTSKLIWLQGPYLAQRHISSIHICWYKGQGYLSRSNIKVTFLKKMAVLGALVFHKHLFFLQIHNNHLCPKNLNLEQTEILLYGKETIGWENYGERINSLPHNPDFQQPKRRRLWKTLGGKRRKCWWPAFSPISTVFPNCHFSNVSIAVCKCFQFGHVQNLVVW